MARPSALVLRGIGVVDPDGDSGAGVPIGLRRGINGGSLLRRPRHDKQGDLTWRVR